MGFGDVGDDGQAKTETIWAGGPVRGGALEGLEQTADLVWCYGGPVLVTVSVASVVPASILTTMCPPVRLWRMALSIRFDASRWMRRAFPDTSA